MRQLLVIVLDATSPELIEEWTDDGRLPNLNRLRRRGRYGRLQSIAEWMPEATSFAFYSGQNPAASGLYSPEIWNRETMSFRPPSRDWIEFQPFWRLLPDAGPRAVILDPANAYPPEPFNGVEVYGWASHDTLAPFQCYPPELAPWIDRRFGSSLVPEPKYGLMSRQEFLHDRQMLLEVNRRFKQLCASLMEGGKWGLFFATNCTGHSAGHKFWMPVNIKGPIPESERGDMAHALEEIYVSLDNVVGAVIEAAGKDTTVLTLSTHGMRANNSRTWIFPEMLARVVDGRPPHHGLMRTVRETIPVEWRHAVKSRLPFRVRRALGRHWRVRDHDWQATKAFSLFSDTQGWVRINLRGREARGIVEPGSAYDELCQQITDGMNTFVDADTGEPLVKDVIRPDQVFTGEKIAELPDLIVRWSDSPASMHRAVVSPLFGTIPWPAPGHNPEGRSGNHGPQGWAIAAGPDVMPGRIEGAHILDLAPTILTLLDQPVPVQMEGKPIKLTH
jgi:predicted AlkP superfamily phosphohydrolase/phosphomutase